MTGPNRVLWSEGLFLRTQHFQQQDRHAEALVRELRSPPGRLQTCGFTALSLDAVRCSRPVASRCSRPRGIFPDGTPFRHSRDPWTRRSRWRSPARRRRDPVLPRPAARNARRREPSTRPMASPRARATAAGSSACATRCMAAPMPEEIEIARPQARLLLAPGSARGRLHHPCRRRARSGLRADGGIALAETFLPPALVMRSGAVLRPAAAGADHRHRPHHRRAWQGWCSAGRVGRVENLLVLELANTARPRLAHMLAQDLFHPGRALSRARRARRAHGDLRLGLPPPDASCRPTTTSRRAQPSRRLTDTLRSLVLSLRHVEPKSRALPVMKPRAERLEGPHRQSRDPELEPYRAARRKLSCPTRRCARSSSTRPRSARPTSSSRCGSRGCPAYRLKTAALAPARNPL
jgi:type VI secretion system protein ImpJ